VESWIPGVIAVVVNIAAIAFAYGRLTRTVDNLKEQMGLSDEAKVRAEGKSERWQEKVEKRSLLHSMLPECIQEFKEINKQLGILTGKVDTLLSQNNK